MTLFKWNNLLNIMSNLWGEEKCDLSRSKWRHMKMKTAFSWIKYVLVYEILN